MNVQKVLFPTDFSEANRPVLGVAASLARAYGADLLIAHVHEPALPPATIAGATLAAQASGTKLAAEKQQLEQVRPTDTAIHCEHELLSGSPVEAILQLARNENADLIIMGTHGRRALSRLLIGSVAEAVVRQAPCPVMTLKLGDESQTDLEINRILFPTDLSDRSNAAIEVASSLAVDLNAELLLLHVNPVPVAFGETSPYTAEVVPTVEELKEQLDQVSLPHPEVSCLRHVMSGNPAATIESFAKQHDVDLIVMATHGHTGLVRAAFGSVAEATVRRAPCPILTVRMDIIDED